MLRRTFYDMLILITLATFVSTLLGGLFALRIKDKLHLVLGLSAGAVVGVAFFDLLPESMSLSVGIYDTSTVATVIALGFAIYLLLDRTITLHSHSEGDPTEASHTRGKLGASSLSFHSFLDGVAVGLAFQVSASVAMIVTVGVLVHDFSDGINTVGMILRHGGDRERAMRWLLIDALAPVLGVLATLFFTLPESAFGLVLALFCGFFLYIGASDLLPESHHQHKAHFTTIATLLGMLIIYIAIHLAGA